MTKPGGADPADLGDSVPPRPTPPEARGDHFAAPLGSCGSGRLRFTNGANGVAIRADPHLQGLYLARFWSRMPAVSVRGGVVTIRHPRVPSGDWTSHRSARPADVVLNASIPWSVEVRGGALRLAADLRGLALASFNLRGGASSVEVVLPAPSGTVAVALLGGASNVEISRPEGVAARLRVEGGATHLGFDERRIGAAGGSLDLRSPGYDRAADRYDVTVTGGVNDLSLHERRRRSGA